MKTRLRGAWTVAAAVTAVVLVAPACSSSSAAGGGPGSASAAPSEAPEGSVIATTIKDFAISLDVSQGATGEVRFNITNDGPSLHEFVVLKTDLAAEELPVEGATVTEDSSGITNIGEAEDLESGSTTPLALTLQPGNYVLMCNIEGHYAAGMRVAFTVV